MSIESDLSQNHLWLSTRVEYDGHGQAEFSDPRGYAEGPATVSFDEVGCWNIRMRVESVECERELQLGYEEFFSGREAVRDGQGISLHVGDDRNPCTRLKVLTPEGRFLAEGEEIIYGRSRKFFVEDHETTLRFHPRISRFDANSAGSPKYWVLPLTNFVTEFTFYHGGVDGHPLRLRSMPEAPADLPPDQAEAFRLWAWVNQPIILFEWRERLCFIEALPDYSARKTRLSEHRQQRLVTAVMVGELGDESIELDALEDWVPADALRVLGFATGIEVSAPWLELYDEAGALVRRVHVNYGDPVYTRGRALIRHSIHGGVGHLLTRFLTMPETRRISVHVAMKQVTKAGLDNQSLEDRLDRLARGAEGVCSVLKLARYSLKKRLTAENARTVESELARAARVVSEIADRAAAAGNEEEAGDLRKVGRKVQQAINANKPFGQVVADLAARYGLPDPEVMAHYYAENPREDGRDWCAVLSMYRGATMHGGGFDFASCKHDWGDAFRYGRHLHDLLARVIFKMVGYEGKYQPVVTTFTAAEPVDWVTAETQASLLGYGVDL